MIVGVSSRLRSVPLQHVVSTDSDEILNRIQFRYVETIDDVINVFIRLHLTNVAPHVVLVDDISTMNFRDKTAAAAVAVLCNSLDWIEKTNRSPSLAIICDTTDVQGSSSMGFITGRWVFQTYPVSEFDPDEVAQKMRKHVPENDAAEDVALFGDE